jgi:hypothetical protein
MTIDLDGRLLNENFFDFVKRLDSLENREFSELGSNGLSGEFRVYLYPCVFATQTIDSNNYCMSPNF